MKDYTNIVNRAKNRKKEEEGTASSSSKKFFDATNTVEKAKLRKRINFDTFESDLSNTSSSLSSIIGGWQTQETMANTRSAIESMYNRTNDYQTYISKYQPDTQHNLGEISKYYKTALDNWDNLSELYGYYKDADSYSTAMRKLELDKQYTGKTYEEIQEEKKKYEADSDVYKYLDSFTGYSNLKDFDKALESVPEDYASALKTARNTYALEHKFDLYADLMQNEDFAELSQYKPTATRGGIWKALAFDGSDETYEFINDVDGARQKLIIKYKEGNGATELETHGYEYMTDEERAVFNYLYAQDKDKAYDYLDDMAVTLSKRLHDKSTAKWEEMADSSALASIGLSLATPIYNIAGGIGNVIASADELITGKEYNPYAPLRTPSNASSDIRQYVGENIAESTEGMEIFGQNIPSFLYQTGMSISDTALGASAFGVGFTGIMGSNAFQQTAREMKEAGADADTVIKMGMASGIAEAVFEYFSIDKLINIKNADGWKNIVKSALKQAGIEATEEMATEGANILSDLWLRQDESELKKKVQDLRDRGYSESEISAEIRNQIISQIGWAGVGGAISGLGMGGAMSANQYHGLKSTGNQIASNGRTQEMVELAGLTDSESETYKLYTEYANKGINAENITPAQLGNLRATMGNEVANTLHSKKTTNEQKLSALDNMENLAKVDTAKTEDEKRVERMTVEARQQAQENQTRVNEMVQAEGREDISFYSESMGQEKAEAFNEIYDGKTDLESYADSFELAYTYGKNKIGVSEALKHKGVLTEAQALKAYEAGNIGRAIEKQKVVDEINKKHSGKTFVKGKFDDSIIDYNGNAEGKVGWKNLTAKQKNAINFVKAFSEVTGVNVSLIQSKVVNEETGKRTGEHGRYEASNNTIYIDVYAGMDAGILNDAIIPTVSHEVTHWMKAKSPMMYQKMQDYALEFLSESTNGKMTLNQMIAKEKLRMEDANRRRNKPNQKVTDEDAIDELVARTCEDMLANSDKARKMLAKMSKTEADSFIAKVKETFENIMNWVNDLLKQYQSNSKEAELLRQYKERMKKLSKMWDQTLTEAIQTNQSMQAEGIKNDIALLEKNGVLANEENATVYSARYLLDEDTKSKVASDLVSVLGVSKEDAMEYLNAETSIASMVLNPKHQEFLDYEADENEVAIKNNSDYPQGTVDFSNICAKRRDFTSVMNRVMSKFKDHIFLSTDLAKIRTIMSEEKITIPCGICYVEDRRQLDSIVAEDFVKALELYRNGSKTRPDGKPFNAQQLKALKMVENDTYTPSIYELITLEGRNALKDKDSNMESAWVTYNNARGMQSVRLLTNEAEYKREILKYSKADVKKKNDLGGLRIYSFSDAEIPHLIDLVQVITDSASKGLAIQGYTKVNWYAKMIKDTGVKLNRSLIPAGDNGYHMEDGKAVLDYDTIEGIDINDKDFFDSTDYDNVGNILIGINEVQIRTAMVDPFVDYIIPFHTGQSGEVLKEKGIDKWQNYKNSQSERNISDGKKSAKQINIYTDVIQKAEAEGNPIKDKVQFVEKFLTVCKENGLIPRFSEFLNTDENGDYIYTEGYHKFIIDFKTFHPITGEYLPQLPVKPIFDNGFITKTLKKFVKQEKAKQAELEPKMEKAVARIEKEVIGSQYSDRTEPIADDDYKKMAKHFGTTGNFNVAGYMLQDGKILDFSGKHWGDTTSKFRQVDHRDIQEVMPDENNGVDSMIRMISNGNIRLMPEDGGINLAVAPSKNQRTVLRRYIEYFKGEIVVDIDAVGGDTVESFRYDKGTSADRIMRDIDNYFRGGRQSELMRFHEQYSDRDYMEAVNNGDMETAQKMVDEVAKQAGYTIKAYHGTRKFGFTQFRDGKAGIFISDNPLVAGTYGSSMRDALGRVRYVADKPQYPQIDIFNATNDEKTKLVTAGDGVYELYAKLGKSYIVDCEGNAFNEIPTNEKIERDFGIKSWDIASDGSRVLTTDSIARYAKKAGYDSVTFKNIRDIGEMGFDASALENIPLSTVYAIFNPSHIKSADAIVMDNDGAVIPLSERFNTESDDIRYSDRDIDSWLDDLDVDDLLDLFWGDTTETTPTETPKKQRAQRRVDEVKKRLDAIGLSFTGTKNLAFTDERIEQYLREFGASNPNYAQAYITYMTPQQYLNLTMGSRTHTVDRIENESASYGEIDFEKLGNNGAMFLRIEEGKNKAEVTGHEGRHRMLLLGKAGFEKIPVLLFDHRTKYNKTAKDSLKLTPQVFFEDDFISKTRDTVVHDLVPFSSGNKDLIIQNFGSGTEADVYYADRDYTSVYELMGEKETLDEENRKLKADIEKLKATIGSEDVTITRFRSLADYLKKQAGSNYSREALGDALKELYTYIQTTENLKWYNVMAKAEEIANEMMQLNVPVNYFREVMNDIRQDRVSLSEEQYAEAVKLYGSYGNLHRALFGSVNLAKSGRPLEAQWKDWSKAFPTVFKADISATDMVKELRDIVDALKSTSAVMGEYERQEAIRHLGMEIYNQFWNIASDSSEAVRKEKVAHRRMMEELRKNYQKRQAEKTLHPEGELALKYEKLLKDTIKRDRNEMKRIRELGNKRMEAHKERAEKNALIQRITTKSLTLNKWLNDNSKNSHVPEPMKPIVRNFLNAIDFSSKKMLERGWGTQRDADLAKALSKVHRMMLNSNSAFTSDDGSNYVGAYFPKGFVEKIGEVVERLEDSMPIADEYILNRMSVEDLRSLDMLVSVLKGSVMDMNKFVATQHKEGIANLSQDGMAYRDKLGTAKEYADWRQWVQKTLNWNNVNPFFAFKRFGEDGKKIFDAFRDGWDKFAFNVNEIIDYAKASYTKKEIKEWRKEIKRDIEISGNRKVTMTIPQIMSVYCLQKREQARKHLLGKGIRVGDIKDGKNVIRQTEGTGQLTQNDIDIIIGNLTVRQKEVADRLQEFMNTVARRWGNEVTMRLHYYLGFEEENYFPIKTDDNYNANNPTDNENDLFRLLNMSFTKSINENANNKIMALDIFDVFAQHTSDMAKYNALALPVYDAFRWYSYKENTDDNAYSVKASLEKAFGKDAKNYIYTFIKDINGIQNVGRDALGTKFFSNAKIASVGANLKVIALQPTSYARAYAVIDAKYLIPALASKVQYETVIVDGKPKKRLLAEKYCGIVQWKTLGFYDTNIQRGVADLIKHEQTWKDMIVEASMKGAGKADELTLGKLWNACEAEVKDKQKNLSVGSEEFYKAVALRLRDVVYNTQVVDSTMTRSQMMRSGDKWDKVTSAFMSEPTLSYNMLQDAYMDYKLAVRETGSKTEALSKHRNKIARVITAYVVTNIFTALLEAGFVGFRDDDEEKMTTEEFMAQLWSNFLSNMSLLGKIPYVKDVISIFQGYSSGRMDTQWAEYAYYSVNGIKKMLEGKGGNPYQMAKNAVRAFSYVSGLPFYNLNRDLKATLDSLGIVSTEELEEMFNEVIGDTYPSLKIK